MSSSAGAGSTRGQWLRVSSRGELTFDRLRRCRSQWRRGGIALTGTTRLSRGVHDRPVPDAEVPAGAGRRAERGGAGAHRASAIATAAEILDYARDYQGVRRCRSPAGAELAERLEAAAATIRRPELVAESEAAPRLTPEEATLMAETIERLQAEVRQNFVELEADVRSVEDPAKRAGSLRDLAGLKARRRRSFATT